MIAAEALAANAGPERERAIEDWCMSVDCLLRPSQDDLRSSKETPSDLVSNESTGRVVAMLRLARPALQGLLLLVGKNRPRKPASSRNFWIDILDDLPRCTTTAYRHGRRRIPRRFMVKV